MLLYVPNLGCCARGQIPRLSDGMGTDKAEGKMTLSGYAAEQTTKRTPKLLLGPQTLHHLTWIWAKLTITCALTQHANILVCNPKPLQNLLWSLLLNKQTKGSHLAAWKCGKHETCEGGSGSNRIHMDGCCGWDAWGHQVGIDEVGIVRWSMLGGHGRGVAAKCRINGGADVEWGSGAGDAGGCGEH